MSVEAVTFVFLALLACMVCGAVAWSKNRSPIAYGLLGLLMPLIGVIVVLLVTKIETAAERHARIRAEYRQLQIDTMPSTTVGHLIERVARPKS